MHEDLQFCIEEAKDSMEKAIQFLEVELGKLRAGRASVNMVDDIQVEYYEQMTPLKQVANVTLSDAKTIVIQPWEKDMLKHIDQAISAANIGITPQNDGVVIRLVMPPLTEEGRMDLVKRAKQIAEQQRVSIRNSRRDANEAIKKSGADLGVSEDEIKEAEGNIQDITNGYISNIDKRIDIKEEEIMTV